MKLGSFEIIGPIGTGGMGQVFEARDLDLGRIVAIKVLRPEIARDAQLLQRFRREAKTLASLNHPHIAQIYGIAENETPESGGDAPRGLVLELVEGDTLEERIRKGKTRTREVLGIASQIADALEAAHIQGIVHRDLKPANIKLTSSGSVKILDFGIATNALESAGRSDTDLATVAGTIIGTPGFMSPEQIRGQKVDKRTDVWAFGCVLYELLTGQPAFSGATDADLLGAILHKEPDWSKLPSALPAELGRLLRRCLRKEPAERLRDMGDIRVWIEDAMTTADSGFETKLSRGRGLLRWAVAAIALLAFAFVALTPERQPAPRVSRLQVELPASAAVSIDYNDRDIVVTPDGSKLVYIGNGSTQVFVRELDALTPLAVHTSNYVYGLFVSPDGEWIGFKEGANLWRKVPVAGGPAVTFSTAAPGIAAGAAWAPDGSVILPGPNTEVGLRRVPASGGEAEVLTRPDRALGEAYHVWPEMLPDGRHVLFTITALTGSLEAAQIAILDLKTGEHRILMRGGTHAQYLASGHLVYAQAGALQAVAFDLARLRISGTPVTAITGVAISNYGGLNLGTARDGTMAYFSAGTEGGAPRTLVWVDREGRETPIGLPPRPYYLPALSPDGTRIALYANDQELDIWLWDLNRTTLSRLTANPARDVLQVWTPDSRSVIYSSGLALGDQILQQSADGASPAELLVEGPGAGYPMAVSPDGSRLIFTGGSPQTGIDLMAVELDGSLRVTPLISTRFDDRNGTISPDARWLAYEANDSGRYEIYVRPYPDVNGGVSLVSTAGGTRPIWTRGGRELVYVAPTGALMSVEVADGPGWSATLPSMVVQDGYFTNTDWWGRSYDVTPDGESFLMLKEGRPEADAAPAGLVVVQNWFEELGRIAPPN